MIDRKTQTREDTGSALESNTLGVYRTAATIKGGRRFSFGALVVVGNRHGEIGIGYGKANEVPPAIEKAEKDARRSIKKVAVKEGTIPHTVTGRFGASEVKMIPASPGPGVVAGAAVRAVLELAGIRDCLTKSYGSNNRKNLVKATLQGLCRLRTVEQVAALRGVELEESRVDEILRRGRAFVQPVRSAPVSAPSAPRAGGGPGSGKKGQAGGPRRSRRKASSSEPSSRPADQPADGGEVAVDKSDGKDAAAIATGPAIGTATATTGEAAALTAEAVVPEAASPPADQDGSAAAGSGVDDAAATGEAVGESDN